MTRNFNTGTGIKFITCGAKLETLDDLDEHIELLHTGEQGLRELPRASRVDGMGAEPPVEAAGAAAAGPAGAAALPPAAAYYG